MIITDESLLRTQCDDAAPDEVQPIIDQLVKELNHSLEIGRPGIGLSAPQIGIHKNVAIIRLPEGSNHFSIDLVNCKIQNGYNLGTVVGEGCLSFPDLTVNTERYQNIFVIDNAVEPHAFIATGILSVAIQHELDHLKGKLLPDFIK
jgi:peptide deformylase